MKGYNGYKVRCGSRREKRGSLRPKGPLKNVYVARTVQERQKPLERFLNKTAHHLGSAAAINALGSTHLTFLQSQGVTSRFRTLGYTPDDVRTFRGELDGYLKETVAVHDPTVTVDPEQPLRWIAGNMLALDIVPEAPLIAAREAIEAFLTERFGELPDLREFEPHITIGTVWRDITARELRDPCEVLPLDLHIPARVALNGLEVYIGRIQ